MKAENGKRVKVQFVGRLEDGTVFGEAPAEKPLDFVLGKQGVIPGFVEAVCGMEPGEKKTVQVPPEKGFGSYDPDKRVRLKRSLVAKQEPIAQGAKLVLQDATGREHVGRVDSFTDQSVTLDMNHPLAGHPLEFEISLQEVA
jgi:peptidylprolyl isomerase